MAASQTKQMPMQTPMDLFVHEVSDIHSAEQIIAKMLHEAQGMASNPDLKQALQHHEQETIQHAKNLEQIFQQLGQERHPVTCHAVEGLKKELKEVQKTNASPQVLDGVIIGGAIKTEHYEIAAYQGLIKKAQAMSEQQSVQMLDQNLQQEQRTLELLTRIGDQMLQQMAAVMSQMGAGQQPAATQM